MARWARRRKYNGIWFPAFSGGAIGEISVPALGTDVLDALAILPDEPYNTDTASLSSSTPGGIGIAIRTGYLLKRVVGQLHIGMAQEDVPEGGTGLVLAEVRAGLFVDRVDETGSLQNLNAWDPFTESAKQKRWLWQRSWILQNKVLGATSTRNYDFPATNAEYNGALSNANIDWKGGARATYEERLFMMVAVRPLWIIEGIGDNAGHISVTYNLRMLGKPISRNNR